MTVHPFYRGHLELKKKFKQKFAAFMNVSLVLMISPSTRTFRSRLLETEYQITISKGNCFYFKGEKSPTSK